VIHTHRARHADEFVLEYDSFGTRKRIAVSQCNIFTRLHSVCGGSITQRHKPRDRLRRSQAAGIRLALTPNLSRPRFGQRHLRGPELLQN